MYDAVIVGAGLSGLVAAHRLHQQGSRVLLIEEQPQVGGVLQTYQHAGYQLETGANTFPSSAQHIMALCDALGLERVETSPVAKKRFVYHNQQILPVPSDPISFLTSSLLSPAGKLRLLQEPFCPHPKLNDDSTEESLADFARRRLGAEALERLLTPFVSGVYAGNPEQLSAEAVFPQLIRWENEHGSLFKGAMAALKQRKRSAQKRSSYQLLSLQQGMGALPQALAKQLPEASVLLNTSVIQLYQANNRYELQLSDERFIEARQVVLATPAYVAAHLLESVVPEASALLYDIPYAPIAVVHTGFTREQMPHPLDGFGVLTTRDAPFSLLGSIFTSSLFPHRVPQGHVLLSNFVGGACYPDVRVWDDDLVVEHTIKALQIMLNAPHLTPQMVNVVRWQQAIPQYTLGHVARVRQIKQALTQHPALSLVGNYLQGVSLNDCVASGQTVTLQPQLAHL